MLTGTQRRVKALPPNWLALFSTYDIRVYRGDEVVRGRLHADLGVEAPDVALLLDAWDGPAYAHEDNEGVELLLVRRIRPAEPVRWGVHGALFGLTVFTTLMAGALLRGFDPLNATMVRGGMIWLPLPTTIVWSELALGIPFAATLLGILLAHEMGHYVAARIHRIRCSLPYFIPFPAYFSIVGTLGAFIRLRGPIVRRSILFDVGSAGPFASCLVSIPAVVVGLALSGSAPTAPDTLTPYVIQFAGEPIWLGDGLLFRALALLVRPEMSGETIVLHPIAFAGWLGLFVTALNLLPFGQLDGGHVLYSMYGPRQVRAGVAFLVALLPLGLLWWGWWFWGLAAVVLSRGRLRHPPVLQEQVALDPLRRGLGWLAIIIFFVTFAPVPLDL